MKRVILIAVLVENAAGGRDLLAEHGLAFWIESGGKRILFDTGQGNALRLGIRLELADAIVLSHGHYDHTGGLSDALRSAWRTTVYVASCSLRLETSSQQGRNRPRRQYAFSG